ncbi:hypothetical protein DRE_00225 [Drechslerella stenobrocha 248]|uniref:DNA mismatch repair protein MSH5 n=1 Tax=Drechslerella stenobrocha 248 TaxID=1043628 RepID=W7IHZ5_9PEZI|nr:hypothetical protein DRE_00225 [Drechslerella stenobrocha 248]
MTRNTFRPRPRRFTEPSFASSPPPQGSRDPRFPTPLPSPSRGAKRARPSSPFRATPGRQVGNRNSGKSQPQNSSSSSSTHTYIPLQDVARLRNTDVNPSTVPSASTFRPSGEGMDVGSTEETQPERHSLGGGEVDNEEEEDEEEQEKEVVMAIDYRGKRLGCTFYTEHDETLWFVNDIQVDTFGARGGAAKEVLESLKFQIQPTIILLPTRTDDLFGAADPSSDSESSTSVPAPDMSIRPAPEFSVEQGKHKLATLNFDREMVQTASFITPNDVEIMEVDDELRFGRSRANTNNPGKKQSILRLDTYIDTEGNYVSVGCAGAVLIYVRRKNMIQNPYADGDSTNYGVSRIKLWTMENTMFVNADTMASLQIFGNESHPTFRSQAQNKNGKESLSLFSVVNNTRTPQGYQYLKQIFLRPSFDSKVITSRFNSIQTLNRPDNSNAVSGIRKSLRKVPDMMKTLAKLSKGGASGGNGDIHVVEENSRKKQKATSTRTWSSIYQFAYNAIKIRNFVAEMIGTQEINVFQNIADAFETTHLQSVAKLIDNKVDFDESQFNGRVCVKPGVDAELDKMKDTYNSFDFILGNFAKNILEGLPPGVRDGTGLSLNVVYYPQLGYLICVPLGEDGRTLYAGSMDEDDEGGRWDWMFGTQHSAYYKSEVMRGLDAELGDIFGDICDREIDILYELQEKIMEYQDILIQCSNICGELDSILSLAQAAMTYNWVRPLITDSNVIKIYRGRHPLQELCVSTFIPNDTNLEGGSGNEDAGETSQSSTDNGASDENKSMMIVTGPNYSGKSVYLKQAALIVYMAHIGCYVPAENATIGLTDAILTRIQTRESVTKMQSAFMIDLQQIAAALRLTSRRSLLIIDEFGKGTESTGKLPKSDNIYEHSQLIRYLLRLGLEAPKTLMATHYHEIFENGFLTSHPSLAFGHMKIMLDQTAEDAQNQITYLYSLESGRSTSSFGTVCAAMNGVEKSVVDRAEDLIVKLAKGEDLVSACAKMTPREAREFAYTEHIARRFLQVDLDSDTTEEDLRTSSAMQGTKAILEKLFDGRLT